MVDLLPILVFAFALYKIKLVKPVAALNYDYSSKGTNLMLKGLFALIIMLGHLSYTATSGRLMPIFNCTGYQSAAFFFFLSGFGLIKSLEKKENYLDSFLSNKFINLILPYLIICLIYWFATFFFGEHYSAGAVLKSFINGNPIVDNSWYLILCILFYLSFFAFAKLFKKNKVIIAFCSFALCVILVFVFKRLGYGTWWYDSNYGYPIGMLWAIYEDKIIFFAKKLPGYIIMLAAALCLWAVTFYLGLKFYSMNHQFVRINAIFLSIIVFLLLMKFKLNSPILKFYGKISLEFYLMHGLFIRFFRSEIINISNDFLWGIAVLVSTTIVSILLNKFFNKIKHS